MGADKALTPITTLLMPVGTRPGASNIALINAIEMADATMRMFALPQLTSLKKHNWWTENHYRFFVRENQASIFRILENDLWKMVTYPDAVAAYISDIREWIRRYPVKRGIVINLDADCRKACLTNSAWVPDWHGPEDPEWVSGKMLAMVRLFDLKSRESGLLFAGVDSGSHIFKPSISTGWCTPIYHFVPGPRNFGENLTFETSDRAGRYPKHRITGEGLYRSLSIYTQYELTKWGRKIREPLGFLDDVGFDFDIQPSEILDKTKAEQVKLFAEEFGDNMVRRRSYTDEYGRKRYGFNQQAAGADCRNRDRSKKEETYIISDVRIEPVFAKV